MEYAYKLTTRGRSVMAACMSLEKPFHITRTAFGAGRVDEDVNLADIHELQEFVSDGAVSERRHEEDRLYLTLQYANSEHPDVPTFLLSEFIVYVEDPETGAETDLLYGTLGDYRQPVPAFHPSLPPSVFNFPLTLILSSELQVAVSAPSGLTTWEDMARLAGRLSSRRYDFTIPAGGWEADQEGARPMRRDVAMENARDGMIPQLTVLPAGERLAGECGLAPFIQTIDGAVRVWAGKPPSAPIPASLTLLGDSSGLVLPGPGGGESVLPPATAGSLGAVKPGPGLAIAPDGTLSVAAASDEEVTEMLDRVFHDQEPAQGEA